MSLSSLRLSTVEFHTVVPEHGVACQHRRFEFRQTLLRVLEPAIQAHISGRKLRPSRAAYLMRRVASYPAQYNALALCYFSADDSFGVLDRIYNQVVSKWRAG